LMGQMTISGPLLLLQGSLPSLFCTEYLTH
jgi:hypothetical protein